MFQAATPFDTPHLMMELVAWVNQERESGQLHPLLIIAINCQAKQRRESIVALDIVGRREGFP